MWIPCRDIGRKKFDKWVKKNALLREFFFFLQFLTIIFLRDLAEGVLFPPPPSMKFFSPMSLQGFRKFNCL